MAPLADVNDDGQQDAVVGSPDCVPRSVCAMGASAGYAALHPSGVILMLWEEPGVTGLGVSVSGLNTFGSPPSVTMLAGDPTAYGSSGRVVGIADSTLIEWAIVGKAGEELGASLCGINDIDFDGATEFIVGCPGASGGGVVRVVSGATREVLYEVRPVVDAPEGFGTSVVVVGDLDVDGIDDFVVGSSGSSSLEGEGPGLIVVSGRRGELLARLRDTPALRFTGAVIASSRGTPSTIFVGNPRCGDEGVPDRGCVAKVEWKSGKILWKILGSSAGEALGRALAAGSDLDGDHEDDVVVSSTVRVGSEEGRRGVVRIHSGSSGRVVRPLE